MLLSSCSFQSFHHAPTLSRTLLRTFEAPNMEKIKHPTGQPFPIKCPPNFIAQHKYAMFFLRHLPKKITFLGYIYQRIRSHVNQYVECWLEGMWSFIQAFQLDSQPFTTETIWQRTSTAVTKFIKPRSFRFIWLPSCWRNVLFFKSCLQEPAKYTGKLA